LLLCASTERATLAALIPKASPRKDAERRDKVSVRAGKTTRPGKPGENFRNVGDPQKGIAGL
jgi:hypothetical protein